MCKINYADNLFRQSQPLLNYIVRPVEKEQSSEVAVKWFNRHTNPKNAVYPLTNLNSTKLDNSAVSNKNISSSDSKGLPNAEQLDHVYNRLGEDVSNLQPFIIHINIVKILDLRNTT